MVSKTLSIAPSEVLKLSEFDISLILEGILYERGIGIDKKDGKTNISEMTDEELDTLKKELMEGNG